MKTRIGKYLITDNENRFVINYQFTCSDFIVMLVYFAIMCLGLFLLYGYYATFRSSNAGNINSLIFGLFSLFLFLFSSFFLAATFYNMFSGTFGIDKKKRELTIVDFFSTEKIKVTDVTDVFYEINKGTGAAMQSAMMCLRLRNGTKKECFVVRSSIVIAGWGKLNKDLHFVGGHLKTEINKAIKSS